MDPLTKRQSPASLAEVYEVWKLHQLICKAETAVLGYQCPCCPPPDVASIGEISGAFPLELPERMPRVRPTVHKAIYRGYILSAVLAGQYKEPLFVSLSTGKPRDEVIGMLCSREYIEQFPVLKPINSPDEEEAIFGKTGEWMHKHMMDDVKAREAMAQRFESGTGRATQCPGVDECHVHLLDGGTHADAHYLLWELMKIFWVWESELMPSPAVKLPPEERPVLHGPIGQMISPVGFSACKIGFPIEKGSEADFEALALFPDEPEKRSICSAVVNTIYTHSGLPNCNTQTEEQAGSMQTKFFHYFLRRYLGLRFVGGFFYDIDAEISYVDFSYSLNIFALDDVSGRRCLRAADGAGTSGLNSANFLDGSEIMEKYDPEVTYHYDNGLDPEGRITVTE